MVAANNLVAGAAPICARASGRKHGLPVSTWDPPGISSRVTELAVQALMLRARSGNP